MRRPPDQIVFFALKGAQWSGPYNQFASAWRNASVILEYHCFKKTVMPEGNVRGKKATHFCPVCNCFDTKKHKHK